MKNALIRGQFLALALLLLWPTGALADENFRCVICREVVDRGFQVEGRFYCPAHVDEALPKCHNCGTAIRGQYVSVGEKHHAVCLDCRHNLPRCFLCSMPAARNKGGGKLPDGREVCAEHRQTGVSDPGQAQQLYRRARTEVLDVFGSRLRLPKPVGEVRLVGLSELRRASHGSGHSGGLKAGKVLGLTTIIYVTQGDKRWLKPSTIHLLNYVPAERMVAVAAHEYAHVWHAENHRDYSQTKMVLREGFAEWVAYKVAQSYGRREQMEIMMNPNGGVYYTGLRKLLELERQRGVDGVLDYVVRATKI